MPEWLVTAMYISVVSCQFINGIKFTLITEKHREYQSAEKSGNNQDVKQVMHWKQECTPVGCVPAARRPYAGVCLPVGGV